MPGSAGGWTGCYCSWKCTVESLGSPESYDTGVLINPIVIGLIDEIARELHRLGVQDRYDNGDILPGVENVDYVSGENKILRLATRALVNPRFVESSASIPELALEARHEKLTQQK